MIEFDSAFLGTSGQIDLLSPLPTLIEGDLTISNSLGAQNAVVNGGGAFQVFVIDGTTPTPNLTIDGLTITGGFGGAGSAIQVSFGADTSNLTVMNSVISGNSAGVGTIYMPYYSYGTLTVQNTTISGNTGGTGGIYFWSNGSLLLQGSTISGNVGTSTASWHGGGLTFYGAVGSNGVTIENSTIHGNTSANATAGSGGVNLRTVTGLVTVRNSTITGNTGSAGGGGIGNFQRIPNVRDCQVRRCPEHRIGG